MKRNIFLLMIIVLFLFLTGCNEPITTTQDNNTREETNINPSEKGVDKIEDREYFVDERASEWFKELYQMNNLDKHEAYITDDTLNISLWFNNNVKRQEIMTSKDYVMGKLVLRRSIIGPIPYGEVLGYDYDKVEFTVYIEDIEILRQNFKNLSRGSGSITIDYYENLEVEQNSRSVENKDLDKFARKNKFRYWGIKDIIFEETYKGTVLAVKFKGTKEYKENDILKFQKLIEDNLANQVDYLGIVLQLYSGDKKYYEKTYHNNNDSDEKYWFEEYWGNHNYFDFNN